MATYTQTLKSAMGGRVRLDQAQRLASERMDLGHSEMCPASSAAHGFDVYGRPATWNTLNKGTADCSHHRYTAADHIQFESNNRPYIPICAAGLRGAADFMGVGRDSIPRDIYNQGNTRGAFVRHYPTANNAPIYNQRPTQPDYRFEKRVQNFDFSHDADRQLLRI